MIMSHHLLEEKVVERGGKGRNFLKGSWIHRPEPQERSPSMGVAGMQTRVVMTRGGAEDGPSSGDKKKSQKGTLMKDRTEKPVAMEWPKDLRRCLKLVRDKVHKRKSPAHLCREF